MLRLPATALIFFAACDPSATTSPDLGATLAPPGEHAPVDGIKCDSSEQLLFHIHAHLAIYVRGQARLLPAGIGIGPPLQMQNGVVFGGSCFSWLHTHDQSGIIHIESPVMRVFTLGNFFDLWGQPLSTSTVGPAQGSVSAFSNGLPFPGDPKTIPLNAHDVIQLDVGAPSPSPMPYDFPPGL